MKSKTKRNVERINLYLDRDLFDAIKKEAQADYLPVATWVKQYLYINLLKNNIMSNSENNER